MLDYLYVEAHPGFALVKNTTLTVAKLRSTRQQSFQGAYKRGPLRGSRRKDLYLLRVSHQAQRQGKEGREDDCHAHF